VSRQYKTLSGTYSEEDLAIVVWMNPKSKNSKQSRALETMTSENSRYPMAFPIKSLTANRSWSDATFVHTRDEVYKMIESTKRTHPLVVPLSIAKLAWGWENFYVPTEYVDNA
jgi:hypothetical protein